MRILAPLALAASAAFALAGCGHADDASQDAQADSVEIPADEALNNTPEPSTDTAATDFAAEQATKAAEVSANSAADAAQDAAADATAAAEAAQKSAEGAGKAQ
jgi:hypothetical protein